MLVSNWINYRKVICKCTKVKEGIKLIYEKVVEENIDIGEFIKSENIKNENIKLLIDLSDKIIKLIGIKFIEDFMKNEKMSLNDIKEKDKILDLLIEYIEKVGFFLNISSQKEFIWSINDITAFIKEKVLYIHLHYEMFKLLRNQNFLKGYEYKINGIMELLDLFRLYGIEKINLRDMKDYYYYDNEIRLKECNKLFDILIDDIHQSIKNSNINVCVKVGDLLSNTFYIDLVFYNLYDLLLYLLLDKYSHLHNRQLFYFVENKEYNCEKCGNSFFIDDNEYSKFPKNMKYCEDCRDLLQKGYKEEYKEKVKIIDELRQYKGKIPKTNNDVRNEYNKLMRLIDNRKKGDKLPTLNELGKMLLKLKNIK